MANINLQTLKKLSEVQKVIDVPKTHSSPDGKYNFFKLGDIYKALEPLEKQFNFMCYNSEDVVEVGKQLYVKSTVYFVNLDFEENNVITATACARECTYRGSGMSESQQTGSATTYARKNAYNALFKLEDEENVDPDTQPDKLPLDKIVESIPTIEEAAAVQIEYLPGKEPRNNRQFIGKPLGSLPQNVVMKIASSVVVTDKVRKAAERLLAG